MDLSRFMMGGGRAGCERGESRGEGKQRGQFWVQLPARQKVSPAQCVLLFELTVLF